MDRKQILQNMRRNLKKNHLLGVATGTGMTASYAEQGGADFILVLNSGRFRQMGRSSLAGFLPFINSNQMVYDFAEREIIPLIKNTPIIFGLNATDPTIDIQTYILKIKQAGFAGINNYPTVGLIDGQFGEALQKEGNNFTKEVSAIRFAHRQQLFTVAFVFNVTQATEMTEAGADVICIHLGLTSGGLLGAKKALSLESSVEKTREICKAIQQKRKNVVKMIYGGPVTELVDLQYMYNHLQEIDGYIGGSTFERITSEEAIIQQTKDFKMPEMIAKNDLMTAMLDGVSKHYDYVAFVKKYIAQHYREEILITDLAEVAHVSSSYLSTLFKQKVGSSFTGYLVRYRINKSIELMKKQPELSLKEIATLASYTDYAQFNKIFKKTMGVSPKQYKQQII